MNNPHLVVSAALASVLSMGLVLAAQAADDAMAKGKEKEKCYGVAKAGANDCANLSGTHTCAGQAKAEMSLDEFNYVAKGSCAKMGGKSEADAKLAMKK